MMAPFRLLVAGAILGVVGGVDLDMKYRGDDGKGSGDHDSRSDSLWATQVQKVVSTETTVQEFASAVDVMMLATRLSYTATWGSYHNPEDDLATLPGFVRVFQLESNPKHGGMRALVFAEPGDGPRKGIVAFRGTDLDTSTASGQADACAHLVHEGKAEELPEECSKWTIDELDYVTRALELMDSVIQAEPELDVLCTGHSLGAGLAAAVAAKVFHGRSYSVAFSTPGSYVTDLSHNDYAGHVNLVDEWDPIYLQANADEQLVGITCEWNTVATDACDACALEDPIAPRSAPCEDCFVTKHIFKHYEELVNSLSKPECSEALDDAYTKPAEEERLGYHVGFIAFGLVAIGAGVSFFRHKRKPIFEKLASLPREMSSPRPSLKDYDPEAECAKVTTTMSGAFTKDSVAEA